MAGSPAWEAAYRRFESPAQEVRKFTRRLRWFGAPAWPRGAHVVELFCGRGSGLVALERLGFRTLTGIDLSPTLLAAYAGPARCVLADCRALPLADHAADIVVIQGGLHHLQDLPADLDRVLAEAHRVLVPNGRLVVVEPWSTPFLTLVDACCASPRLRRGWRRLDALATMVEHERATYEQWLAQPAMIRERLERRFRPERVRVRWGKLFVLGRASARDA